MTKGEYGYKIDVLKAMLEAETDPKTGGYGAHLSHWAGGKEINLDASAIRALIRHYKRRNGE